MIKKNILSYCPNLVFKEESCKLFYVDINSNQFKNLNLSEIPNDGMLIVNRIHDHPENNKDWESLKKLEEVRVTIDLFYCGIVFFRKEQAKEHFKIKI